MIPGIIILIVMILMVVFLARRVKSARKMFDDIQVGGPEDDGQVQKDEEEKIEKK